jgi:hypothetical protein
VGKAKHKAFLDKHLNLRTILVALMVVMFWRGAWGVMDLYLFPDNQELSLIASLVIGLLLLFVINHRKLRGVI